MFDESPCIVNVVNLVDIMAIVYFIKIKNIRFNINDLEKLYLSVDKKFILDSEWS